MKKYENPMMLVISIKKSDIVCGSTQQILFGVESYDGGNACAPERFWYYEGE